MGKLSLWEEQVKNLRKKVDEHVSLTNWEFIQGIESGELPGIDDKNWTIRNSPITWSMKNGAAYLRKLLTLPAEIEGISTENSNIDLTFLFPSGVELFIDGKKVYSHKYWADKIATPFPFMQKAKRGEEHLVVFKTPQGDGYGTFWAKLNINSVEDLLFELNSVLYQTKFAFKLAEQTKHLKKHAEEALNTLNPEAIADRNWKKVLSDIRNAEEILEPFRKYAKQFRVHLIGHAHIDMNWLWNYEDTVNTCLRDFETINRLMDKYPDLTFSQSQAHVYTIVEKADETLFKKVQEKIKQGRWEVTASSWVEGDLNIVDGESIVRHILYSNKYAREKLGTKTDIFWSPDTFGHPATTPSALSGAGLKYYYFMRCGKGMPLFRWKGRDGKELIAFNSVYNNRIAPETVMSLLTEYCNKYEIRDFLFLYGVGDHGGGPTESDIKRKMQWEKKPAVPALKFSTAGRYFRLIEKYKSKLPVVTGELNTIFEGCYTTHSDIKRANRECENLLFALEAVSAAAGLKGGKIPEEEMEVLWQKVLFNQFHDILDGSAIHSSYDYSARLANEVKTRAKALTKEAVKSISSGGSGEKMIVFNPLGWERTAVINLAPDKKAGGENSFIAKNLCGYGYKTISVEKSGQDRGGMIAKLAEDEYENEFYRIKIDDKTGLIRELYDKENKCEVLSPCLSIKEDRLSWRAEKAGNLLNVSWEKPHTMSAWIIGNVYRVDNLLDAETVETEEDTLKTTVKIKRRYMDSDIQQKIILYPGFPFIDFENEINWRQQGNDREGVPMLRVNFNVNMKNPDVFFEVPFGAIKRETLPKEYPALKWAGFNSGNYWTALLNRDKYGYHVDGNNLSLTLLRNPYEPDAVPDSGLHKISYRLFFGKTDVLKVTKAAWEYNVPPIIEYGQGGKKDFCPFTVKGKILPACFKKALGRDSYILRLVEVSGKKKKVEIEFVKPVKRIYLADSAECRNGRINTGKGDKIKLDISPFQILTLDMEF